MASRRSLSALRRTMEAGFRSSRLRQDRVPKWAAGEPDSGFWSPASSSRQGQLPVTLSLPQCGYLRVTLRLARTYTLLPNCCSGGLSLRDAIASLCSFGLASPRPGVHARRGERHDPQVRVADFGRPGRLGDSGVRPDRRIEHRHRQAGRPADARRDRGRRGSGSGARAAAGRYRRNRHHRDAPQPGAVRRSDGGQRGHGADSFTTPARPTSAQLDQVSPSLLVSSTTSEAGAAVARIRGIGTVGDNPGLEGSVGVFIDGVYRPRAGMGLTDLGRSTGSRCCAGRRARCSAATPRPA